MLESIWFSAELILPLILPTIFLVVNTFPRRTLFSKSTEWSPLTGLLLSNLPPLPWTFIFFLSFFFFFFLLFVICYLLFVFCCEFFVLFVPLCLNFPQNIIHKRKKKQKESRKKAERKQKEIIQRGREDLPFDSFSIFASCSAILALREQMCSVIKLSWVEYPFSVVES